MQETHKGSDSGREVGMGKKEFDWVGFVIAIWLYVLLIGMLVYNSAQPPP